MIRRFGGPGMHGVGGIPFAAMGGIGQGAAATPASGMVLWLKSGTGLYQDAAKTTPAANGDAVGAWADQSGNGNDATQATAGLKPVRIDNVVNGIGVDGRSYFHCDSN